MTKWRAPAASIFDAGYVSTYDQKAATDPSEDLDVLRHRGLDTSGVLVDFGAGTGTFALAAAPHCRKVIAVDVSAQILNILGRKGDKSRIGNIELVEAGFLSYEHQGEPVDTVYSRHALHHLPDFWKALALKRVCDMLRPGGVFLLRDLIYSFDVGDAEEDRRLARRCCLAARLWLNARRTGDASHRRVQPVQLDAGIDA